MNPPPMLPRLLLAAPLVLALTVLAAVAWPDDVRRHAGAAAPVAPPVVAAAVSDPAVEVLRAWDRRRAAAWAAADTAALRTLYVPGSRAGEADVALLEAWVDRRVRVVSMTQQLLGVEVVEQTSGRLVLRVTDRLARVVAQHRGRTVGLPDDRPSTHLVTMVQVGEDWLVEEVEPARSDGDQPAR